MPGKVLTSADSEDRDRIVAAFREVAGPAGLILANLEAPITKAQDPREDKLYNLKAEHESLDLFDDRFVLGLANNHIMDFGTEGLLDTLSALRAKGLRYCGAGSTLKDAAQPSFAELNGTTFAFIAAADPRYAAAGDGLPGTCPASESLLRETVNALKPDVHVVCVSLHLGMEFVPAPTPLMRELARTCIDAGASVVAFHHAHCLSGWTRLGHGAVLWGLGNFFFPHCGPRGYKPWFDTARWDIRVDGSGEVRDVGIHPAVLKHNGEVRSAPGHDAKRIMVTIGKWSRHIQSDRHALYWRIRCLLRLGYLRAALGNYVQILQRKGFRYVLRVMMSTIKVHFAHGRETP